MAAVSRISSSNQNQDDMVMVTTMKPKKQNDELAVTGKAMLPIPIALMIVAIFMICLPLCPGIFPGHLEEADPGLYQVCVQSAVVDLAIKMESVNLAGIVLLGMSVPMLIAAMIMMTCTGEKDTQKKKTTAAKYCQLMPEIVDLQLDPEVGHFDDFVQPSGYFPQKA